MKGRSSTRQNMTSNRSRRTVALAFAIAAILIAGGCGTSSDRQVTQAIDATPGQEVEDLSLEERVDTDGDGEMSEEEIQAYARTVLLDFSDCMRNNGFPDFTDVVLEDFTENPGGQGRFLALMSERGVSISDQNAIPTLQSCGENLSDLQTFAPQPSDAEVEEREALVLEFAACMRGEGLQNWPDPDFANNNGNGYGPELLQEFDLQSDEVQDAIATCQAANAGATIGQSPDDASDGATDGDTNVDTEEAEDIDRNPISSLIEGDTASLHLAEVIRKDLVQTKSLTGTLGYGEQRSFPTNSTGIVTALPTEGEIIGFGDVLFHIDNEPVLLFEGPIPQYRPFRLNMADGPDVQQLEQNLATYDFAADFDLTVDEDFTSITRDLIEELQLGLGADDTGRIDLGRIVFSATPVRVGAVNVELGQSVGPQTVLVSVTESEQRITMDLDADDRSLVAVGTVVDLELPDGTIVLGRVSEIADIATRTGNQQNGAVGDPTIEVTVVFAEDIPEDLFDAAPVEIIVTEDVSAGVLTVPVPALIAMSGGGHAVELVVQGGTQLIPVELGDFVDEIVEVKGDLQEGDTVVMAAAG